MLYGKNIRNAISYVGISKPPVRIGSDFKEFNLTKSFYISQIKPNIKDLVQVKCSCEILKTDVVRTPKGESSDGNILTGLKLFFSGMIKTNIQYSIHGDNKVHYDEFKFPFSESFSLKENYSLYLTSHNVSTLIIDVNTLKLSDREVFLSILLLSNLVP
ncbi:MAG: hypothetical protein ACRC2K_12630 [Clostridium sp.]